MWNRVCSLDWQLIPSIGWPVTAVAVLASAAADGTRTVRVHRAGRAQAARVPSELSEARCGAAGGRGAAAGEGERDADDQGYDDGGRTRARQPQAPPLAPGFLRADLRDALAARAAAWPCCSLARWYNVTA